MRIKYSQHGFTLVELLIVVVIVAILAAIALPMYQKAVLKSRFSAMMPIAKAMADANEAYYLEHGRYSEDPTELIVQGKDTTTEPYPDGTSILMYRSEDDLSFVRTENSSLPNARYVVYQKHSKNFADTTWCEANDEQAEAMCVALGGVLPDGLSGNSGSDADWTAYLLSGEAKEGDSFASSNSGSNNSCQEGDTPPEDMPQINASNYNSSNPAVATATCVNGQWKYTWSGGTVYKSNESCIGDSQYACVGSSFTGQYSWCSGRIANGCEGSSFKGRGVICYGNVENGCAGTTFDGENSSCYGKVENGCAGAIIHAGSSCTISVIGGCDGVVYAIDSDEDFTKIGCCDGTDAKGNALCPSGSPKCGYTATGAYTLSWWGNCCNPAIMGGTCPPGVEECATN